MLYYVFDIYADPCERHDFSKNTTLLAVLLAKYNALGQEPINWHDRADSKKGDHTPDDPYKTTCEFMNQHGGYWQLWHTLNGTK